MVTPASLLADYTFYWLLTGHVRELRAQGRYFRTHKATPARIALFAELIAWCREGGIDPRLWIYTLFRARQWRYPPMLTRGHLMSPAMIDRYKDLRGLDGYRRHLLENRGVPRDTYDPNRDVNVTVEARKRYYLETNQLDRCLREMVETLGFHPASHVCQTCPERVKCRTQLEGFVAFDVIALREGRISAEQAMLQVRRAAG